MAHKNTRATRRGGAILELALFSPWVFFLFVGAIDWGFYAYSLITVETAARSGAVYESAQMSVPSGNACTIVSNEMSTLMNAASFSSTCSTAPLVVSSAQITGPDSLPAAQVTVTYTTPSLIPIPGVLAKQFTITRIVTMKIG